MPDYELLFTDILTDDVRAMIHLDSWSYSRELNRAGSFDGVLSLSRPSDDINLVTAANLDPARTAIYVLRRSTPTGPLTVVWGGILWAVQAEVEQNRLRLGGQGFWSYFKRRHVRDRLTFSDTTDDQFDIAESLIDHAQEFNGGDLGVTVNRQPTDSGRKRTRTYHAYERKPIAEAIEQLAAVNDGFDFELVATGNRETRSKTLHLNYPRRGRTTTWVWKTGKNATLIDYTRDGLKFANHATAIGSGEAEDTLIDSQEDPTLLASYPLLEHVGYHKSVEALPTLRDHAIAELQRFGQGEQTLTVELVSGDPDAQIGAFIPGDEVRVQIDKGYVQIDSMWRLMRFKVNVTNDGDETIKADLAPVGAFS